MATVSISRGAFSAFYAAPSFLLVGAEDYGWVKPLFPEDLVLFILGTDGVIRAEDAASPDTTETVSFIGMAGGLNGILVNKNQEAFISALFDHCLKQNIKELPSVHYLGHPWFSSSRQSASQFLAKVMVSLAAQRQAKLGTAQKQITHLRGEYERLWLGFEKARRMIQGIGYKTRSVAFRLEPGANFHDPNVDGAVFRQYLPTDLAGFAGIKLFVPVHLVENAGKSVKPSSAGDGKLKISIQRAADNAVVASADIAFSEITEGWLKCSFPQLIPLVHGDGILEITWQGENGPALAFADIKAERFGDDDRRSLAIQIEKGLAEPVIEEPPFERATLPLLHDYRSAGELVSRGFAALTATDSDPDAGNDKNTLCDNDRRLQTHASAEGPSGVRVFSVVTADIREVSVQVCTAHEAGPDCLYVLMVANSDCDAATVLDCLNSIGNGDQPLVQNRMLSEGMTWSAKVLPAHKNDNLTLLLPSGNSTRGTGGDTAFGTTSADLDLILAVRSVDGDADYTHCQWQEFIFGRARARPEDTLRPSKDLVQHGQRMAREIRTNKIPELASQIVFYKGQHVQNALSAELGFSPLTISEETGTLQTHPLDGALSAAILRDGLPIGAKSIKCVVGTAHPDAPSFTYILGVLPPVRSDRVGLVEHIQEKVAGGEAEGQEEDLGLQWTSVSLPALESAVLALSFAAGVTEGKDVMFAAVTAGGGMGYGWCRWYSYDIISNELNAVSANFEPAGPPKAIG